MTPRTLILSIITLSAISSASAFLGVVPTSRTTIQDKKIDSSSSTPRHALIYGWDGDESDSDDTGSPLYFDEDVSPDKQCPPIGIALAETLSYDEDKAGHLARLAAAFSPPERSLRLDQIQKVQVICVREETIEIEAIICEDGGCVSISVPVKFPRSCTATSSDVLEGCVYQNLDELDEEAESSLSIVREDDASLEDLCLLNGSFEKLPDWWVPPECDVSMAAECEAIKQLLNEDEFQPDSRALAQDALRGLKEGRDYSIQQVKVAIVGPAGICFKVRAKYLPAVGTLHTLDLLYPFGGEPMTTADSLRAAVLGAVAAAEGE
jgi:hypothetical protein